MTGIITDIISFLKSLTFVDYVLYFSVLVLIILMVSLVYIVRTSTEEEEEEDIEDDNDGDIDLVALSKEIDEHTPYNNIDLTDYETEQEEKAIISYDELIKQHKNYDLNYEKESNNEGISIKKIDNQNPVNESLEPQEEVKTESNILFTYDREEEFLRVLKQLNKLLN